MFCKHCGNEIPNNSIFCTHCGKPQSVSAAKSQNATRQTKKKSRKKPILISLFCLMFAIVIVSAISSSNDGYSKLAQYDWGATAEPILRDIGVQKIKEIRSDVNSYDFYIITEKTELDILVIKDSSGRYEIFSISVAPNSPDFGKCYYYKDSQLKDEQGRYLKTIYDYSTNTIVCTADEEAVLKNKEKADAYLSAAEEFSNQQKAKKKEEANKLFQSIISDYQNNEVAAENKYKGNTYTVSGTIQDIGLDVVDNPYIVLSGDMHVTFYFHKSEKERIAQMNKGDTIVIEGKCDGAGVILDLTFSDCQVISDDEL